MQKNIDLKLIDPSPFQVRKYSDEDKVKELAVSIKREGLIEPIVVRLKGKRYEIIAGHRRMQAIRDYTDWKTIPAQIIKVDDLQAWRISLAENLQREDLSAIETIEAIVKIVDAELIEDKEYAAMGKTPANRVKTVLGKLDSMRRSKERRYTVRRKTKQTSNKFVGRVEKIFKTLPKPLEWLSFLHHDLPLVIDFCKDVQEASIHNGLNGTQTRALAKLKSVSNPEFQRLTTRDKRSSKSEMAHVGNDSCQTSLKEMSAREIDNITDREVKKGNLKELNRTRVSPSLNIKEKTFMMSRLGFPAPRIAARLEVNRLTALKYSENPNLVRSVLKLLKKGHSVEKVSKELGCPEPLVWSIALEGKSDQERFKALGWGLRAWDNWYFNDLDQRFGDDWPGQIPAQLVGHTLYYFSEVGDLVFDPMAGGGVVPDMCLAFGRKCWSFDLVDRPETRPEIEPFRWDPERLRRNMSMRMRHLCS